MKCCFFLMAVILTMAAKGQDTTYKEMVGKYKFPPGTVIEEAIVTFENGVLNMNSVQGTSVLERIKGDTFNVVSFNGIAVFKRDEIKKINGVHVDASGYVMDGEKEVVKMAGYLNKGIDEELIKVKEYLEEQVRSNPSNHRPLAVCIYN